MNVEPNYYSSSSFSDEEEDNDMFFPLIFVENKNNYIPKEPQRISMLTGDALIKEILYGNPRTCYELFRMDRPTFTSICAIVGTYISAWAPTSKLVSYRNRKATITHNIMCACDFDMKFTFVYTGWKGTANDSRVFLDALQRPENNFPWPQSGGYYLVDSGYPCTLGFLPPYRTERYHLQDFRGGDYPEGEGGDNLGEPSHTVDLTDQAAKAMVAYRDQISGLMLANNRHH
ncbi:hypothetical protein SO802_003194 [Lithocarpus litseifolius]|uniref:DDE Tnp4 domain-containing protein n=1 Tax=Lithocarpus litseifolius TaxID=425828 RepID=A0AAW2DZG0_9ROSI